MPKNHDFQPSKRMRQGGMDGFIAPRKASGPRPLSNSLPPVSKPSAPSPTILPAMRQPNLDPFQKGPTTKHRLRLRRRQTDYTGLNRKTKKRRSKKKIIFSFMAILTLVFLAAAGWDAWQLEHKVNHLNVGNLSASVNGAENILVAGSTNRCNLKVQNAQWGFCSQGVTGVNSDVIFVVHLVPATHTVSILSIPRDTFVPNARAGSEAFKIDAALYEGPTQLVNAVEEDFGIPIQHYMEVGFDGFVNIVNAIGGVKMDFPMPVYDSESHLDITTPGCKLLNGVQALQVVRARHLQYKPPGLNTSNVNLWPQEVESDIARIARSHEFLRILASTITAKGLSNPITDQKLVDAFAPQVQVDSGLSTSEMIQLALDFHKLNINKTPQYTLPISLTYFGNYYYENYDYGDVVFPAEPNDQKIIDEFLGVSSNTSTLTGKPLPSPSTVAVSVTNGSGISNQATQTSDALQALGFNVVGTPATATPRSYQAEETFVYYRNRRSEPEAQAVANQLTGSVILAQNPSRVASEADVTVFTGNDLAVNAPTGSSSSSANKTNSSSSQSSSNTTSTNTATAANAGLATPTSATQGLSPWDPRACTK